MIGQFIYANGLNISQAKKIFKFYFGDFFIRADKNDNKMRFDIFVRKKFVNKEGKLEILEEYCDLDYFNKFWNEESNIRPSGGKFNVILMDEVKK